MTTNLNIKERSMEPRVLVLGLGEVGKPLMDVLRGSYGVAGKDVEPLEVNNVDVLHICYPFQIAEFISITVKYIKHYKPDLVVVNSTVTPGTTRKISEKAHMPVAYSPIRGKHVRMKEELLHYTKFVGGTDTSVTARAHDHFKKAGFKVRSLSSCEALELAKIMETTYFGLLVAWAQEIERFCGDTKSDYNEVMSFVEEVKYLPPVVFKPGYIGGHCVMPNIRLMEQLRESDFLKAIKASNETKAREWISQGRPLDERMAPTPRG